MVRNNLVCALCSPAAEPEGTALNSAIAERLMATVSASYPVGQVDFVWFAPKTEMLATFRFRHGVPI